MSRLVLHPGPLPSPAFPTGPACCNSILSPSCALRTVHGLVFFWLGNIAHSRRLLELLNCSRASTGRGGHLLPTSAATRYNFTDRTGLTERTSKRSTSLLSFRLFALVRLSSILLYTRYRFLLLDNRTFQIKSDGVTPAARSRTCRCSRCCHLHAPGCPARSRPVGRQKSCKEAVWCLYFIETSAISPAPSKKLRFAQHIGQDGECTDISCFFLESCCLRHLEIRKREWPIDELPCRCIRSISVSPLRIVFQAAARVRQVNQLRHSRHLPPRHRAERQR